MKNISVYFDSTGYGLVRYNSFNGSYKITFIDITEQPSCEKMVKQVKQFGGYDKVFINDSKVAKRSLYGNNYKIISKKLVYEKQNDFEISFLDCYETISSLLTDEKIEIQNDYLDTFTNEFQNYSIEDKNHIVLATFQGIAVEHLAYLSNKNKRVLSGGLRRSNGVIKFL